MRIANIHSGVSFKRALTSLERKEHAQALKEARKELNLGSTTATIFDFSVPTSKNDPGIGTTFSDDAVDMISFLKEMCSINSLQVQPQSQISNFVRSPYSGTNFSLGMHLIDLNKLADDSYANLLTQEDLDCDYLNRTTKTNVVDYDNVFSEDGHKSMLRKAYARFEQLDEDSALKQDFNKFLKENSYWVEKDALFEAAAVANGSENIKDWSNRDQNVFATKEGDKERIAQLHYVKDKYGNNVVEFEEFIQFIADKQQKESKANLNAKGIDVFGDCHIGSSQKDFWAHKSAFYPNYDFGCDIGGNNFSCWSPALDLSKLNSDAGELLYEKFNLLFKRYNGVRIDAAWQLIKPVVCEPLKDANGNDVFDANGNKLGTPIEDTPVIKNDGQYIIKDIILKAADKNKVPHSKVFLELLGGNAYNSLDAVRKLDTPLIHISRYGKSDWGRVKYYESKGSSKYQNMKPGQYTIGPGTHDDNTLVEQAREGKSRIPFLAQDLHLDKHELEKSPEAVSEAICAELFTTQNQFMTLPDILGSDRRINLPNTIEGNWSYRATMDYEKEYFENLSKGKGLNTADAMSKAIKAKHNGKSTKLTQKLDHFAAILKQNGPMTTKEADKLYLNV